MLYGKAIMGSRKLKLGDIVFDHEVIFSLVMYINIMMYMRGIIKLSII